MIRKYTGSVTTRRNVFYNAKYGFREFADAADTTASGSITEHNEAYDCTVAGFLWDCRAALNAPRFRKNTANNCVENFSIDDADSVIPIILDNIGANGDFGIDVSGSLLTVAPDFNCFYNNTDDIRGAVDANNIFTNPTFISTSDSSFTIDSTSPCWDTASGFADWHNETDRLGNAYTKDNMGAFA